MRLSMRRAALLIALAAAPCTALRVPSSILSRRSAVGTATAAALFNGLPASAVDKQPVVVLGANGGTGLECVNYLVAQGRPCIAATRTGDFVGPTSPLVTVAKGDVTSSADLKSLITPDTAAVIYAASASRKDGAKKTSNAKAVVRHGEAPSHDQPISAPSSSALHCSSAARPARRNRTATVSSSAPSSASSRR